MRNNGEALGRIGQEEEALLGYQWPVFDIQRLASTSSFRPFGAGPWGSRVEKESRKTNSEKKLKKLAGNALIVRWWLAPAVFPTDAAAGHSDETAEHAVVRKHCDLIVASVD